MRLAGCESSTDSLYENRSEFLSSKSLSFLGCVVRIPVLEILRIDELDPLRKLDSYLRILVVDVARQFQKASLDDPYLLL